MSASSPGARALGMGEGLLAPLDRARARANRLLLAAAPALARKQTRLLWRALVGIALSLGLALHSPLLLFAVAPVVLGLPHLAADLRYLVLRPRYGPSARAGLFLGCVPFVFLRLVPESSLLGLDAAQLEIGGAGLALVAVAVLTALSARAYLRLALAVPALVALALFSLRHAEGARIVFAHLHNLVALVVWLYVFRPRGGRSAMGPVLFALVLGLATVFAYGALGSTGELDRAGPGGVQLAGLAAWLAPGLPLRLGVGLVLSYVFLQSVHYSVWLGLIPEDAVRGDAVRSFRMSLRALVTDLGRSGLLVVVLGSGLVIGLAARDLTRTRDAYLSLSAFHGYLELAVLTIAVFGQGALVRSAR